MQWWPVKICGRALNLALFARVRQGLSFASLRSLRVTTAKHLATRQIACKRGLRACHVSAWHENHDAAAIEAPAG